MDKFKNILITGASSGIGQGLAESYANNDVTLYLSGRNLERLEEVANNCKQKGANVDIKAIDVCNQEAMAEWVQECDIRTPLDLIIANAGVSATTGEDVETAEHIRTNFSINVDGVLNTVLPIIDKMQSRGHGQIGIVSSVMGFKGFRLSASYSGSKAAVRVFGEGLRANLKESGVGVSVIIPAMVKSRMTDALKYNRGALSQAKAANIIKVGLAKNKPRIGFSKLMYFIFWLLGCLPRFS